MPQYTVTPWEVYGQLDYNKLIEDFGTKPIDDKLLKHIKQITGDLHPFLTRKIFFSHRDLDKLLERYDAGEKFYLYTGRAPSGPCHVGHLVVWMFTKWLQDKFNANLLFQIPDEEKFLFKDVMELNSQFLYRTMQIITA